MGKSRIGQDLNVNGNIGASTGVLGDSFTPDAKAVLDLQSTTKGFLPPRMTTSQRDAIISPPLGLSVFNTTTNKLNVHNGAAWVEVGSGSGQGGINYISANNGNADFETDASKWATYADTASALPVDGTGGTASVTFTRSTTSPLRGLASALITKDASNRQGQGVSYDFTIDAADQAKTLSISFDYLVLSGTYSGGSNTTDSDLTVYVYDVTNARIIQPSGFKITGGAVGFPVAHKGCTFQTSSNSTSYRLIFHVATTSASAWVIKLDNVVVGPQAYSYGAPVTDWTPFTPTGSWTTNTTYSGRVRQVGDQAEYEVYLALTGAPNSAALSINLHPGHSIDTSKLTSTANGAMLAGSSGSGLVGGQAYRFFVAMYNNTTSVNVYVMGVTNANFIAANQTSPFTWGSGDFLRFTFRVPISGWSSNVQMSANSSGSVIAAKYNGLGGGATAMTPNVTNLAFPGKQYDLTGAVDTSSGFTFVAQVPGVYEFSGRVFCTSGSSDLYAFKNGVSTGHVAGNLTVGVSIISYSTYLNAGEYIQFRAQVAITQSDNSAYNYMSVSLISGPTQIAASATVTFSATTSTTAATSSTPFIFSNILNDSHGGYSAVTGRYTVQTPGSYLVFGSAYGGVNFIAYIVHNGASIAHGLQGTVAYPGTVFMQIPCRAGDTIEIRPDGNVTANGSAILNRFSVAKIGN